MALLLNEEQQYLKDTAKDFVQKKLLSVTLEN